MHAFGDFGHLLEEIVFFSEIFFEIVEQVFAVAACEGDDFVVVIDHGGALLEVESDGAFAGADFFIEERLEADTIAYFEHGVVGEAEQID